jgi:hypothetical protein
MMPFFNIITSCENIKLWCLFLAFAGESFAELEQAAVIGCVDSRRSTSQKINRYISSKAVLSQHAHSVDEAPHPPIHVARRHPTMILDLDETCIFGNDGNDLGIALQCMGHTKDLDRLYEHLINPALRPAFEAFRASDHCNGGLVSPHIVIYTARSTLLYYASEFRQKPVALR